MAVQILGEEPVFPDVSLADEEGLLAIGGDLSTARLLAAYNHGIFPWYSEDPILWWSPDPRFVLFPEELKVSKSMQSLIRKGTYRFTVNRSFADVISHCKAVTREGQEGTWITDEVKRAYIDMHKEGYAHSAETWMNGKLVGGLYGIRLGNIFFGESMFSTESNASKFAFVNYVERLKKEGVVLIDCQVYTEHLESLGAKMIGRASFMQYLSNKYGKVE